MASRPRRTNLVPPLARFVGRGALLDGIAAHVAQGDRMLTLLGAPGIGKTRLAMRFAELQSDAYLGVWFCDLAEARSLADVCAVVAKTLGLRVGPERDAETAAETVGAALAEAGPMLVVLDNFEQLVSVAARAVERWCAVASEACFLVTSRMRLDVVGERVVELPALESESAQALFIDRARAAAAWDDTRASATRDVAALVRALDGIPLAIELATARSRVLAPGELLARIERERSEVLSSGGRAPGRHATLRAAIDGSWELLSDVEKAAFAQCAVFAGDFSLDAAEAILDVPSPIDALAALRDKSLLKSAACADSGATRFSLFASIREYASERLRSDASSIALRHRRHYLEATRPWAEQHARNGDAESLSRLAKEKEHLLAIQRSLRAKPSLSHEEAADLARAVLHLQPVVVTEGVFDEQLAMLTAAIDAAKIAGDDGLRGRLLVARGLASGVRGDMAASLADLGAARDLGRARGDRVLEAEALTQLGVRYRVQGKLDDAWAIGEQAAALVGADDQPRVAGTNQAVVGLLLCELGRVAESRAANLRARATLRMGGDRWYEGLAIANLAQLDQAAGDFEQAAHGYERALERLRDSGDRRYEARYLECLASLELERGGIETARALLANALEILAVSRSLHIEGITRATLGALEAISGHAREAIVELDRAEDVLRTTDAPSFVAALSVHRGQLEVLFSREAEKAGDLQRAEKLAGSARARIEQAKNVRSEDTRFAIRLLERELARRGPAVPPRRGVDVGPDARWFRVGDGERVDLGRRGALRLLLDGLVARRLDAPGSSTSWDALLGIGWPGERVLADAGATRVRVAVSTLRRLGLAGLLVTREDGYLLDPRAPVRRLSDAFNEL
ncbi:MAG: ATP-binding protein [Polyangiales bacterium]